MAHEREACTSTRCTLLLAVALVVLGICCAVLPSTRRQNVSLREITTLRENENFSSWRAAASRLAGVLGIRENRREHLSSRPALEEPLAAPLVALPRGVNRAAPYVKQIGLSSRRSGAGETASESTSLRVNEAALPNSPRRRSLLGESQSIRQHSTYEERSRRQGVRPVKYTNGQNRDAPTPFTRVGATTRAGQILEQPDRTQLASDGDVELLFNPWLVFLSCLVVGNLIGVVIQASSLMAQIRRDRESLRYARAHDYSNSGLEGL